MATKFITNNETSLSNTVKNLIHQSKALDFLVGFFYFSGFSQIYKEVESIPLRILVGMDADVDVSNRIREFLTYFPEDQILDTDAFNNSDRKRSCKANGLSDFRI